MESSTAILGLATGTEEGRALGLDDAAYRAAFATLARLVGPIVDQMLVLITSRLIQSVSVGAVGQCRAFVFDGS